MSIVLLMILACSRHAAPVDAAAALDHPDELGALLASMVELDQRARGGELDPGVIERITTPVAAQVFDHWNGWPPAGFAGDHGSQDLWILVQHTQDWALMKRAADGGHEAVARGALDGSKMALLFDRYLLFGGQPQVYGTQATTVEGVMRPIDLRDPADVDARRQSMGLPPLDDYLQQLSGGAAWSRTAAPMPAEVRRSICASMRGLECPDD